MFSYVIYLLDIAINMHTATLTEFGNLNRNLPTIRKHYVNEFLLLDLLSVVPADFAVVLLSDHSIVAAYLKLLRVFKTRRVVYLIRTLQLHATYSLTFFKLFQYFVFFVFFSHLSACLFFYMVVIQDSLTTSLRFDGRTFIQSFTELPYHSHYEPLLAQSVWEQYIHILYWSYSITATGAYGDTVAITVPEKLFNMILMILSTFFVALIYAEAATVITIVNQEYTDHLAKLTVMKE